MKNIKKQELQIPLSWMKSKKIEYFERELQRREHWSIEERFRILQTMIEHAKALDAWPPNNPLEGIEKDIQLMEILKKYAEFTKKSRKNTGQNRD